MYSVPPEVVGATAAAMDYAGPFAAHMSRWTYVRRLGI